MKAPTKSALSLWENPALTDFLRTWFLIRGFWLGQFKLDCANQSSAATPESITM